MQRLWQGLAGLITVFVITSTLTHEQQGWYYTFVSIAALYSLFEMGLSAALIQFTAHMFIRLHWLQDGRVAGDYASTFHTFFSSSVRVYAFAAVLFSIICSIAGVYVFSSRINLDQPIISWAMPWFTMVLLTAVNMMTLPFLAVVEGSGEVAEVYKVRLIQGLLGAILCWIALLLGWSLWAATMMPLSGIFVILFWLLIKRFGMLEMVFKRDSNAPFNWFSNIWPHQWRLGLNWVSVFLMSQLATPILFYFCDAVVAGRMGLSLTVGHMLGILAQSWIARHVPLMAQAVAMREWHILDQFFKKNFIRSVTIFLFGAFVLLGLFLLLADNAFIQRLLNFWDFVGLLGFVFFYNINGALSAQLRSYRREPLVWVSVVGSSFILLGSFSQASQGSVSGVVLVMFAVQALFVFPLSFILWRRFNRIWRAEASS